MFNLDNYFISTNFMYIYSVNISNLKNRIFLKKIEINSKEKYKISTKVHIKISRLIY